MATHTVETSIITTFMEMGYLFGIQARSMWALSITTGDMD
jgi:hypothetical protein